MQPTPPTRANFSASPHVPLTQLGKMSVKRFMRDYWQRRPLLIKQALPGIQSPITTTQLFTLAQQEDVESRLVTSSANEWTLRHGPFSKRAIPSRKRAGWTLLVQGVDLHHTDAAQLLQKFRFVPDARLDDLMMSYASDGGGVGAHVDSYDVFLLQVQGRRRWRISKQRDLSLQPNRPLKLLANFQPTHDWVLEPGDMLYLPPHVAHEGVAVGSDCITCSIGFRTPTYSALLNPWLDALAERLQPQLQNLASYRDAGLQPTQHPARLPKSLVAATHQALTRHPPQLADAASALLIFLTEPKEQITFDAPSPELSKTKFIKAARRDGVRLHLCSRLMYEGNQFAMNGELFVAPPTERELLVRLADDRHLNRTQLEEDREPFLERLYQWYRAGWVQRN